MGKKMKNLKLKSALLSTAAILAVGTTLAVNGPVAVAKDKTTTTDTVDALPTKTPIKHLVVVFNENRSFDHYFGTYPNAINVEGEPRFEPKKNTPTQINNLLSSPTLLDNNPNANPNDGCPSSLRPCTLISLNFFSLYIGSAGHANDHDGLNHGWEHLGWPQTNDELICSGVPFVSDHLNNPPNCAGDPDAKYLSARQVLGSYATFAADPDNAVRKIFTRYVRSGESQTAVTPLR